MVLSCVIFFTPPSVLMIQHRCFIYYPIVTPCPLGVRYNWLINPDHAVHFYEPEVLWRYDKNRENTQWPLAERRTRQSYFEVICSGGDIKSFPSSLITGNSPVDTLNPQCLRLCQNPGPPQQNKRRLKWKRRKLKQSLKQMAAEIEELKSRMQKTEDIEAIKKITSCLRLLPRTLAGRRDRRTLFHNPEVSVEINGTGFYKGWDAHQKKLSFADHLHRLRRAKTPLIICTSWMPIAGIIDVEPDGKNREGPLVTASSSAPCRGRSKSGRFIGVTIWENVMSKRTASGFAGKEFWEFPDAVLFDIEHFPDGHTDERPLFDRPRHGAEEEAVPAALRGFAVRFDIDNAGNRHQDVQIIRGRFFARRKRCSDRQNDSFFWWASQPL